MLTPHTIATVKATAPALAQHGLAITARMYDILFQDPAIKAMFDHSKMGPNGSQPQLLAQAVLAYARNVDNLSVLGPAVERIAQRHAATGVKPEHYPIVGAAILQAIKDVLGDAATPAIVTAWGEAFGFLADIMIDREAQIYAGA